MRFWQGKYWQDDEQNCQQLAELQVPPVQVRKFVPLRCSQALPARSVHIPDQVQALVQTSCEHGSHRLGRVAPGTHSPAPEHAPKALHGPQPQLEVQVRVRERVPQPHASVSVSTVPATHSPSPTHVSAPHAQALSQARMRVPQRPHAPPDSTLPAAHSPLALQPPAFIQRPPTQSCCCVPQNPHGTSRGGSPSVHSHVAGAEHAPHVPAVHVSVPTPHGDEHARLLLRPISGAVSSQSSAVGTPSPSASARGSMQVPSRQSCVGAQAGTQSLVPASSGGGSPRSVASPASSWRTPGSGVPPVAHAATSSAQRAREAGRRKARSITARIESCVRAPRQLVRPTQDHRPQSRVNANVPGSSAPVVSR